jgi:hypothetical protein
LAVNRIDRERLKSHGDDPANAMTRATDWYDKSPVDADQSWLLIRSASIGPGSIGTLCDFRALVPPSITPAAMT